LLDKINKLEKELLTLKKQKNGIHIYWHRKNNRI
jgi:hypothetical protein